MWPLKERKQWGFPTFHSFSWLSVDLKAILKFTLLPDGRSSSLAPCSSALQWQCKCRKAQCTTGDLSHFQSYAAQLELRKISPYFKSLSKHITRLNKNFPQVLLFLSPINCRALLWTLWPLGYHCLLQILTDPRHIKVIYILNLYSMDKICSLLCASCNSHSCLSRVWVGSSLLTPQVPWSTFSSSCPITSSSKKKKKTYGGLELLLKLNLFFSCVIKTAQIQNSSFYITIQNIQNTLGLNHNCCFPWFSQMQIYLPSKCLFCLLWENILPLGLLISSLADLKQEDPNF